MLDRELINKEFGFLGDDIYLNISQVGMPPVTVQRAYGSFMDDYVKHFADGLLDESWGVVDCCRANLARLIHADDPLEIGFVKNTSEGMSILASSLPMEPGDNVVIADQEHQSTLFPWINAHELRGIELKVVKSINGAIPMDEMIAAIDDRTRVLAVSSAQFSTGFRADLELLGKACHEKGVIFAVDGIQTLGRLELNVRDCHIDWLVAGSNKGLLGSLGCGFIYCRHGLVHQIVPPYAGYQSTINHVAPPSITTDFDHLDWHEDSRRFESGNLSYNCILAVEKGTELLLRLGVSNIEEQVLTVEKYLREKIKELPLHVVQPADPRYWSGIICIYYPPEKDEEVVEILRGHRIHCTMRGGYIRLGIGLYNNCEQMDKVAEALFEVAKLT